jgi:hypothetical protein
MHVTLREYVPSTTLRGTVLERTNGDVCVDGVNVSELDPEGISNVGVDAAPLTGTRTVTVKPGSVFAYVLS